MNLYEIRSSLSKLAERLNHCRKRLTVLDPAEDEARETAESNSVLDELANLLTQCEDSTTSIEVRLRTLLGAEKETPK